MSTSLRFLARVVAALGIAVGCGGGGDGGPASPDPGALNGEWSGCLAPTTAMILRITHEAGAPTFSGTLAVDSDEFPIAYGAVTGSNLTFLVETSFNRAQFTGTLSDVSETTIAGNWGAFSLDSTVVSIGEFRLMKSGAGETPECTVMPTLLEPNVRLEGDLMITTVNSLVTYSGVIKNHSVVTAKSPQVTVRSFDVAGALISTDTDDFTVFRLPLNRTADFAISTTVYASAVDSTHVQVTWDPPI